MACLAGRRTGARSHSSPHSEEDENSVNAAAGGGLRPAAGCSRPEVTGCGVRAGAVVSGLAARAGAVVSRLAARAPAVVSVLSALAGAVVSGAVCLGSGWERSAPREGEQRRRPKRRALD